MHPEPPAVRPGTLIPSGIEAIGSVPWGTHFCQFYSTQHDLVEVLVPYFQAGLAGNEFCMWITSTPLQSNEAIHALRKAMPGLDEYIASGQIEVLDYRDWYVRQGRFDADEVLQGWSDKLEAALRHGFAGLRLSGNTFWLEQNHWDDFTDYEEKVNTIIGGKNMMALCTYSLQKCGVKEILDVVTNHQFALIKTHGTWEIIESAGHQKMEQALRESEERYRTLFTQMTESFGLHEIITDETGQPVDYRFIDVNPAFENATGLKREVIIGHTVKEILPGTETYWIKTYGEVALSGKPAHISNYSKALGKYYDVYAYCPAKRQFATVFMDVTEEKMLEEQAREAEAHVALQHRLMEQREQERLQIARELHDGPIQDLTYILYSLQTLNGEAGAVQTGAIDTLSESLSGQIAILRGFSQELRPPILATFGLEKALQAYIETFQQNHPDLVIDFKAAGSGDQIPEAAQLAIYRIFQETLTNIHKHSQAANVVVRFTIEGGNYRLEVHDDGAGFAPPEDWLGLTSEGHLGLVGMRERAESVGGTLRIHSSPGQGTRIVVTMPASL